MYRVMALFVVSPLRVERDRAGDAGGVGGSDVRDDRVATAGRGDACRRPSALAAVDDGVDDDVGRVVGVRVVGSDLSPGNFASYAAVNSWPCGSLSIGRPTEVAKSPSACSGTGELDELGVVETVAAHERGLDAAVLGLLGEERAGVVDAAVVDDVRVRGLDLGDESVEVRVLVGGLLGAENLAAVGGELLGELGGQTLAVRGRVVDDVGAS